MAPTWKLTGGGFRAGSWDPIRDGNRASSHDEPTVTQMAPKCPVVQIQYGHQARARRLWQGRRRPGGGVA
jgi:hypothetical protein